MLLCILYSRFVSFIIILLVIIIFMFISYSFLHLFTHGLLVLDALIGVIPILGFLTHYHQIHLYRANGFIALFQGWVGYCDILHKRIRIFTTNQCVGNKLHELCRRWQCGGLDWFYRFMYIYIYRDVVDVIVCCGSRRVLGKLQAKQWNASASGFGGNVGIQCLMCEKLETLRNLR